MGWGQAVKKHHRDTIRTLEAEGYSVTFVPAKSHCKLKVRLHDGTIKTLPISGSPKNDGRVAQATLRQVRAAEKTLK